MGVKLLLGTHAFLWWVNDDPLPDTVKQMIAEPSSRVYLSTASVWEMAIKAGLGKLTLPEPAARFAREQCRKNRFRLLPIRVSHLVEVERLPLHHRDPFDRLLVAQARVAQWPLVSADQSLDAYAITRFWARPA